jgi:quercetin 2,3-dioxygenase
MSNQEHDPAERVCAPGRFTDGLSSGVRPAPGHDGAVVEVLEPRVVPLGGPRAMPVQRTLPQRARSLVGAWCFLDAFGPDDVSRTGGMDVPRHPHTGLATVSWLFQGQIDHVDSAGHWARVRPGEVHLMSAGAGITHTEYSAADTSVLHGAQLWYALPEAHRFSAPDLHSHRPRPVHGEGWQARVFLGELLGQSSPVPTCLPLTGAEFRLEPGAVVHLDVPAGHEHGVLAAAGTVQLQGVQIAPGHLGVVEAGTTSLTLRAGQEPAIALLIGGEPLGEQIVMWWNFVGRSHDEIVTWRAAYQQEMGFEAPDADSPLAAVGAGQALGRPVSGTDLDALEHGDRPAGGGDGPAGGGDRPAGQGGSGLGGGGRGEPEGPRYADGRTFPQFGLFPDDPKPPIPAPPLPHTRMRPRG